MSNTNAVLGSLTQNLATIAKNDALKGFLPVLDNFLTQVTNNQAGLAGDVADFNALGPALAAAAPQVGAGAVKDAAGTLKAGLDTEAAKLAAGNGTESASTAETSTGTDSHSTAETVSDKTGG